MGTRVRYRYVITNEGTVEAETTAEAEAAAFEALELGAGIYICTIEPLPGEARKK
jgi:predicted RNase H-like HicB family nuclease